MEPVIDIQPQSIITTIGSTEPVVFSVTASNIDLSTLYAWFKNNEPYTSGVGLTSITVNEAPPVPGPPVPPSYDPVSVEMCASYTVQISNSNGSVTSSPAILNAVTQQPVDTTGDLGGTASFSIALVNETTATFAWKKEGNETPLSLTNSLVFNPILEDNSGNYYVDVSDSGASYTSSLVSLTVNMPPPPPPGDLPIILTNPATQIVTIGSGVAFFVIAESTTPMTYQWKKGGQDIADASDVFYQIVSANLLDQGIYSVAVTNDAGTVDSSGAQLTVYVPPPVIAVQPESTIIPIGVNNPIGFFVGVEYPEQVTNYTWYKNDEFFAGGPTLSNLYVNKSLLPPVPPDPQTYDPVTADMAGQYYAIINSPGGIAISNTVTFSVITEYPQDTSGNAGETASMAIGIADASGATFEWTKTDVSGVIATTETLTFTNLTLADAGQYLITVTQGLSSFIAGATLTVNQVNTPPFIVTQPANQTITVGQYFTFSVDASGTEPLSYQWKKGGVDISGATSNTYTKVNAQSSDAGSYTVQVTNVAGNVTSDPATLNVNVPPTIITPPASQSVNVGGTFTFSVDASGTAPLFYQWRKNETNITGATSRTYTKANAQPSDAGPYTVRVTNVAGNILSSSASLTVNVPPTIITQPVNQNVITGQTFTFSVDASGTQPLSYQWVKDGTDIIGATSRIYSNANAQLTDAGLYSVRVSNMAGNIQSNAATLTVISQLPAPTITNAVAFDKAVQVAWAAIPIPNATFTATLSPNHASAQIRGNTASFYGLTNGTPYTVTVTYTTKGETSLPAETQQLTPNLPEPPNMPTLVVNNLATQLTVTFSNVPGKPYNWFDINGNFVINYFNFQYSLSFSGGPILQLPIVTTTYPTYTSQFSLVNGVYTFVLSGSAINEIIKIGFGSVGIYQYNYRINTNADIISGPFTRLYSRSLVRIDGQLRNVVQQNEQVEYVIVDDGTIQSITWLYGNGQPITANSEYSIINDGYLLRINKINKFYVPIRNDQNITAQVTYKNGTVINTSTTLVCILSYTLEILAYYSYVFYVGIQPFGNIVLKDEIILGSQIWTTYLIQNFMNCTQLQSISCANIRLIGENTFEGCTSLENVNFPLLSEIRTDSFKGCTSLKQFIGNNVTTLPGTNPFQGCTQLAVLSLNSITGLPTDFFKGFTPLKDISLLNISYLDDSVFENCTSLEKIVCPNVTALGRTTFYSCSKLQNFIGDKVTKIKYNCFTLCTSLVSVSLASLVEFNSFFIFDRCSSLVTLNIPNMTSILTVSFPLIQCTSLRTINVNIFAEYIGYNNILKTFDTNILFGTQTVTYPPNFFKNITLYINDRRFPSNTAQVPTADPQYGYINVFNVAAISTDQTTAVGQIQTQFNNPVTTQTFIDQINNSYTAAGNTFIQELPSSIKNVPIPINAGNLLASLNVTPPQPLNNITMRIITSALPMNRAVPITIRDPGISDSGEYLIFEPHRLYDFTVNSGNRTYTALYVYSRVNNKSQLTSLNQEDRNRDGTEKVYSVGANIPFYNIVNRSQRLFIYFLFSGSVGFQFQDNPDPTADPGLPPVPRTNQATTNNLWNESARTEERRDIYLATGTFRGPLQASDITRLRQARAHLVGIPNTVLTSKGSGCCYPEQR